MAGFQRCDEARHLLPVLADDIGTNAFAQERRDRGIGSGMFDRDQPTVREVAQPRAVP
ncbi:hypothetical protein ABIA27_001312 [Sinorhizobium fredii]